MKPPRNPKDMEHPAEFYYRRWICEIDDKQVERAFFSDFWKLQAEKLASGDLIRMRLVSRAFEFTLSVEKPARDVARVSLWPKVPEFVLDAFAKVEAEERDLSRKAVEAAKEARA